jgi:putative uncharacterized protein GLEAN_15058
MNSSINPISMPLSIAPFGIAAAAAALYGNANIPLSTSRPSFGNVTGCETLIPIPILSHSKPEMKDGFYFFREDVPCLDQFCIYLFRKHFHCSQPRCYYTTNRDDALLFHLKELHENVDICEGFVCFDQSVDCRLAGCSWNKERRHFHCIKLGCNYSFIHHSEMSLHEAKHQREESDTQHCKKDKETHMNKSNLSLFQVNVTFLPKAKPHNFLMMTVP